MLLKDLSGFSRRAISLKTDDTNGKDTDMSASIITITREFGSGGRTIGRQVADTLGYDFYDWELVVKVAKESGFTEEFVEENAEDSSTSFPWLFKNEGMGFDLTDQLYLAQCKVIQELAQKGNCVIVGRLADYILRDRTDVLNVFIFANEEFKKKHVVEAYGETEVSIDRRLREKDRKRKAYYQYYTGRKWGRSFYYDLCLNSGRLGLGAASEIIVTAARTFPCTSKGGED